MHRAAWATKCLNTSGNGSIACRVRLTPQRCFHNSGHQQQGLPNHYETLGVQSNATDKEIKKRFYTLSKSYHPDLHPNDPDAAKRFVEISEAYNVLSSADKRHIYDRDHTRAHQQPGSAQAYPSGSFSSASTPAGGRPASGLSRRRTQFRGPPPSFYRAGGWGEQGTKRAEYASQSSHSWEGQAGAGTADDGTMGSAPGTGPGGFTQGFENDVPHFDSKGHYQTHSTIERTRHKARRRVQRDADHDDTAGSLFGFVSVSAVLGLGIYISSTFAKGLEPNVRAAGDEK